MLPSTGPQIPQLEGDLEELGMFIAMNDLKYKKLGIRYHCVKIQTRELDSELRDAFDVRPNLDVLPTILREMGHVDKLRSEAKGYMLAGDSLEIRESAAATLKDAHDRITELDVTMDDLDQQLKVCEDAVLREGTAMDSSVRGFARFAAMDPLQQERFHLWALETKEVKAAIKLSKIVEAGVDEFVLEEVDRPVIEEPETFSIGMRGETESEVE